MDKWFAVDNYVKYMTDRVRSLLKRAAKNYTIYDFYQTYSDIVRRVALDLDVETAEREHAGHMFFPENGMFIHDVEVLSIDIQRDISELLFEKQEEMIRKTLELADAKREIEIAEALSEAEKKKQEVRTLELLNKMELQKKEAETELALRAQIARQKEAEEAAKKKAELDMQPILDAIADAAIKRDDAQHKADLDRKTEELNLEVNHQNALATIESAKQAAYANTVKEIMASITPDLIAALEVGGKCDLMATLAENMSPLAIANGESIVDTTDRLIRGTPMETSLKEILAKFK
jgi:major vault protein